MKRIQFAKKETIASGVFVVLALMVPMFISNNYLISVIVQCFLFSCFGVSWNILGGYGGQISWCHAAFASIGAYTSLILYSMFGVTPLLTVFVGIALAVVFATIIGRVTFRYRGPFFAITTIAFGEILRVLLLNMDSLTGGSAGMYIPYNGPQPWCLVFQNDRPFYYIALALLLLALLYTKWMERSKMGYYLRAIKGDEDAAQSLGMDTSKVKVRAFQISAAIMAISGMVYGFYMGYVEPQTICGLDLSIRVGAVVIIGGIGRLWGPVLGAFVVIPAIEVASALMGSIGGAGGTQLLYGLVLIVVVILRPDGLLSLFDKSSWKQKKKLPATETKEG